MSKKLQSNFKASIILLMILTCIGCATMSGDLAMYFVPTYQEVTAEWPSIKEGYGRVLIYFPRQGLKSVNMTGIGGLVSVPVVFDKDTKTFVGDRTFVYADLTKGKHILDFKEPSALTEKKDAKIVNTLEIDLLEGNILYIKIDRNYLNDNPPQIVNETEALEALKKLHHNYVLPLPVHDQPEGATMAI